jgi:potassium voltage-gated channel Eag-related subfamily H protein 8
VKEYFRAKMKKKLNNLANKNKKFYISRVDHNFIMRQIVMTYAFRVVRIIIIIFTISYFIGTLFYIMTWLIDDAGICEDGENFFSYPFAVGTFRQMAKDHENIKALIAMWYWATTTLASVGYGDIRPISNSEFLVTALIFLMGVASFSFIMGNFIEMLMEFRNVTAENEDHAGLTKFFGLLSRFNKGHPLQKDMTRKIEEYFDNYWSKDLNFAMKSEQDKRFLSELPKEIRVAIYKDFLFHNFLYKFKFFFTIRKNDLI